MSPRPAKYLNEEYSCRITHSTTMGGYINWVGLSLPFFCTFPEPIGSAPPKVVSKDKFEVVFVVIEAAANLVCPAQGFPVPAFRYFVFVNEIIAVFKSPLGVRRRSFRLTLRVKHSSALRVLTWHLPAPRRDRQCRHSGD